MVVEESYLIRMRFVRVDTGRADFRRFRSTVSFFDIVESDYRLCALFPRTFFYKISRADASHSSVQFPRDTARTGRDFNRIGHRRLPIIVVHFTNDPGGHAQPLILFPLSRPIRPNAANFLRIVASPIGFRNKPRPEIHKNRTNIEENVQRSNSRLNCDHSILNVHLTIDCYYKPSTLKHIIVQYHTNLTGITLSRKLAFEQYTINFPRNIASIHRKISNRI